MPISPEGDEAPVGTSDDRGTAPTAKPTPDEEPTRPVKARPRSVYDETPPPGEEEEIEEIDAADVDETSQVSHPGVAPAAATPTAPPRTPAPARTTRPTPAPPPPGRATRPTPAPIVAAAAAVEFSALPTAEATALLPIEERRRALTAIYQKELAVLDAGARSEAALLQHELGELLGGANNEAEAVKAYAKALQLDPAWKPNLLAIRAIFEERKLWPNLLKLLDAEVRFAVGEPDRAEALVEKGRLLESELKDAVGARAAYEQATQADATCLPAWMALEKMALREGNLSALQTALAGLATATPEPSRKVALLLDLARLQDSVEGGTLDEAFGLCRRAAAVGWEPVRALSMMERLAESAGRHAEMVEALDRQAQLVTAELAHHPASEMVDPENDPRRRLIEELVGLRRRQSAVLKTAGDPAGALAVLEAVAASAPDDPLLFLDASAQLAAAGRFSDLAQLMALRGARWADAAAQPGGDVVLLLRARWERARVAALRAAGRSDEAAALEASIGDERALDVLLAGERDALTTGDAAKLVSIYEAEAKLAVDAGEPAWAVGALIRAAALTGRQLGRTEEAALLLKSALALVPHHLGVVAQLDQLYAQASQPAARAQLLSDELAALDAGTTPAGAPPAERRWRWLSTLADLYQIDLNDAASSLATVRRLVALRPDDARGQLRLVELLRAAAETDEALRDELVAALARAAALFKDDARVALQMERADLLARHGRPEAAAAFAEILAESPSNSRARAAYARLCRARGTDGLTDLAASLRREADATLQGPRAIEVLLELADLEEHERGDRVAAAKVYRDLLDRAPGHAAAVRGLIRTLTATGDRRGAADASEQELDSLTVSAKVAALVALGEDHEEAGASGKPESETLLEQADDAYRRALEIAAGRPAQGDGLVAAALLGRLRTGLQRREATVQRAALAELLTLPSSAEAEVAAALWSEAALVELRAGDLGAAAAQLAKASAASATAVAPLLGEALLGAREGASVELAGVLERWSARTNDNDLRAALLRRAGWMTLAKGRRAAAVTLLRAARQADPRDALTLMALAETDATASELEARAQLAEGGERVAWLVEAAEAAERSGELKEAGRLALAAQAIHPLDVGALLVARRVARAASDLAGFAEATVRLAEQLLEAERSAALFNEAGAAFEEVGQSESAALAYRAVLDRTPLDGSAWRRARALFGERYQSAGDAGPLLELLDHRLASLHDAADRTAALLDRAALLEKRATGREPNAICARSWSRRPRSARRCRGWRACAATIRRPPRTRRPSSYGGATWRSKRTPSPAARRSKRGRASKSAAAISSRRSKGSTKRKICNRASTPPSTASSCWSNWDAPTSSKRRWRAPSPWPSRGPSAVASSCARPSCTKIAWPIRGRRPNPSPARSIKIRSPSTACPATSISPSRGTCTGSKRRTGSIARSRVCAWSSRPRAGSPSSTR